MDQRTRDQGSGLGPWTRDQAWDPGSGPWTRDQGSEIRDQATFTPYLVVGSVRMFSRLFILLRSFFLSVGGTHHVIS